MIDKYELEIMDEILDNKEAAETHRSKMYKDEAYCISELANTTKAREAVETLKSIAKRIRSYGHPISPAIFFREVL